MTLCPGLLTGCTDEYPDFYMGSVHVKDVALAHILLYENPSATGRHLCIEAISHWSDFASKVAELYPDYKVPRYDHNFLENKTLICQIFDIITQTGWFLVHYDRLTSNEASRILVCRLPKDTQPGLLRAQNPAKKLIELGMEFTSMEQIIKDAVESLKSKGYI